MDDDNIAEIPLRWIPQGSKAVEHIREKDLLYFRDGKPRFLQALLDTDGEVTPEALAPFLHTALDLMASLEAQGYLDFKITIRGLDIRVDPLV